MRPNNPEDFWKKIDRSGGPNACWNWMAGLDRGGYGNANYRGKQYIAHRLAYKLTHGEVPRMLCHTCDNRRCCNPTHVYAGNPKANRRDQDDRGRRVNHPKGSACVNARLTDEQVVEIRRGYSIGNVIHKELAAKYGVTSGAIRDIVAGVNWKHLPTFPPPPKVNRNRYKDDLGRYSSKEKATRVEDKPRRVRLG